MEDKMIIIECLKGNSMEFAKLVTRYQHHVLALARNILGDADEARDVVQETFFQVFKNLKAFDINRNFKSWLLGVAVKRSIDKIRRRKLFFKFFKHQVENFSLENKPIFRTIEESPLFNPLLNVLNSKERSALSLKLNENYSAREIAEILKCSENTVRVYLYKARQKLKKELQQKEKILKNENEVVK
jgi:RNA polymerase sigma-70 factor (ECF subfamily)